MNHFTQISVSLGTMSIRPDSPRKKSGGYQITSNIGCMYLRGPVQHKVNDIEMYFSSSSQASYSVGEDSFSSLARPSVFGIQF